MSLYSVSDAAVDEIIYTEHIKAPVGEVFRAMTVSRIIDEWGGGPAKVQAKAGGKLILWDGEMTGIIRECVYPVRLVHTLREASWDSSMLDSIVTWELKETAGKTRITMRHTGLPNRKIREMHKEGWGEYFLGPLKAYLEKKALSKKG